MCCAPPIQRVGLGRNFDEGWKGPLKAGYAADLAVLSADPTATDPSALGDLRGRLTAVDGTIVHDDA